METRNITLVIPKQVLSEAKLLAIKRHTSLSALMTQLLSDMIASENGYISARTRHLICLDKGVDLDTRGAIHWTREDVHELNS
jgi:hypothetical protein